MEDAAAIAAVYAPYVSGSIVSFETEPPDEEEMRRRISAGGSLYPWLAASDEDDTLLGFAYASPFRPRDAYRFTVETSVYLSEKAMGRGLGETLYRALLDMLVSQGFTQAIAAISLPNLPSIRLHERLGFTLAGTYRDVGYKLGGWRSVGLWQRGLASSLDPPAEPRSFAELWSDKD